ncbi:histidine kinase, partial [Salmonella enterica]|uniref:histidine kinase n=3 Tax=Pseudomonadota TaxID=1224 RepID=UPI001C384CA0
NDGVWNRTGATLEFDVPPTFLQSNWFIALCGAAAALLLWMAYRLRVRQLTARMRERLEQRLAERERIARDLHDTLLQGFQGLILRFQSVANEIPENLSAHRSIGQALDNADKILSDGRDSVKQLRTVDRADIVQI